MRNLSRELEIRREPVEGFDRDKYVPKDLYDSLIQQMDEQKKSVDDAKGLIESLNETNETLGKRITTLEGLTKTGEISIDQFGNITTKWPWLTKLLDVPATQARIIKVLQEKPSLTAQQLAQRFGMGDDSIRKHLEILGKKRILTKNYRSYPTEWKLSEN